MFPLPEVGEAQKHEISLEETPEIFSGEPDMLFQELFSVQEEKSTTVDTPKATSDKASDAFGDKKSLSPSDDITQQISELCEPLSKSSKSEGGRIVHRRWGRKHDKNLFQVIRDMEKEGITTLDDILELDEEEDLSQHRGILQVGDRAGWRSSPAKLLLRIKALKTENFSFREVKALKKILKNKYEYENINFEKVIYEFPGKTMKALKIV